MVGKRLRARRHRQGRRQDGARGGQRRGAEVHGGRRRLVRRRQLRHVRPRLRAALPVHVAERAHLGHGRRAGRARCSHREARQRRGRGERLAAEDEEAFKAPIREQYERRAAPTTPPRGSGTTASSTRAETRAVLGLALAAALNAPDPETRLSASSGCEQAMFAHRAHRQPRRDRRPHRSAPAASWASAPVAVYSDADRGAPHVRSPTSRCRSARAGRASRISTSRRCSPPRARTGADAIHPGYGFLAENAGLRAGRAQRAGIVFVGPSPDAIAAHGRQARARASDGEARRAGRSRQRSRRRRRRSWRAGAAVGFPLLVKAAARRRRARACASSRDAARAGGRARPRRARRPRVRRRPRVPRALLERARHVEVQVLGDGHGNVVHASSATARCSAGTRR